MRLVAPLLFCDRTKPNKNCKRATKPTHQDRIKLKSNDKYKARTGNKCYMP
jgi:hypothetical protein